MGFPVMKKLEEYEHFIIPIRNVSIVTTSYILYKNSHLPFTKINMFAT